MLSRQHGRGRQKGHDVERRLRARRKSGNVTELGGGTTDGRGRRRGPRDAAAVRRAEQGPAAEKHAVQAAAADGRDRQLQDGRSAAAIRRDGVRAEGGRQLGSRGTVAVLWRRHIEL